MSGRRPALARIGLALVPLAYALAIVAVNVLRNSGDISASAASVAYRWLYAFGIAVVVVILAYWVVGWFRKRGNSRS